MNATQPAPGWFKVVAIVALLWNLLGVLAFLAQNFLMTPEVLSAMPEEQAALITGMPLWANIAFATAVFGGALGSLMLLLKKNLAVTFFTLHLVGVLVQDFHSFVMTNALEVYGPTGLIMPALVIVIGVFLLMLSIKAKKQGWTA